MDYQELLSFYRGIAALKATVRKGWIRKGVGNAESVADHVFGVSFLAVRLAAERGLDIEKVAVISLIHDVCEILTGDITPYDGVSEENKRQMEREAARDVLGQIDRTGRYFELWTQFADGTSAEGRFVKDVDRLELALQASCYDEDSAAPFDEFFEYANKRIQDPSLRAYLSELSVHRSAIQKRKKKK